jgi:hypothetical protein
VDGLIDSAFGALTITASSFMTGWTSWNCGLRCEIDEDFIASKVPEVMASRNMANNPRSGWPGYVAKIYRSLM